VGAFVAERAGMFDPADVRDALPGLGAPDRTLPAEPADDAAPAPQTRPPETAVARPERKPAPDAVAPTRKPETDSDSPTRTAQSAPASEPDDPTAATGTAPDTVDQDRNGTAPADGDARGSADTERTAQDSSDDGGPDGDGSDDGGAENGGADPSAAPNRGADGAGAQQAATDSRSSESAQTQAAAADGASDSDPSADPADASAPRDDAAARADAPAVRDPDSGMQLTVPAREGNAEAPSGATVAKVPTPQIPSFDIVRVERSGEAVIAGRAAPRSRVTVLQGDEPIATTEADERGEFVAIPHRPLPPGQRQLTLRAEDPESGETTESDRAVVIDIPRMPDDETPDTAEARRTAEGQDESGQDGAQVAARTPSPTPSETPTSGADAESASESSRETVAVRDNRPTAEPPLLADRSDGSGEPTDQAEPRAGGEPQTAGESLTVPAPPGEAENDGAPPAAVSDVPEPPGAQPEVTTRAAETASDDGPRVTARQDRASEGDGTDSTATRSMRPQPARPAETGATEAGETTASGSSETAEASRGDGARDRGDSPIAVLVPREGTGEVEVLQRPSGETGLADRRLVLEAVQYTVDGGISISGRAPSEAMVVAYLNETELARVRAPTDGDWTMAPEADVPPGLHTLRVDQLGPAGEVQASVSTPFANQPMVDELDQDEGMVVIQPGDNLWTIARRTYGQGWEYTLIYRANRDQIRDPDLIYPGQVFVVPEEQRRGAGGGN
jgi:nucleoid-associated protein YgaU